MACYETSVFEKPVCLIYTDDDGHLCITEKVLEEIRSLTQTFHVVTITGLCRTGKSYLLNRLAKVTKAFPLGSSIESKTKGIWIWCQNHPEHKNDILLLMDTEGLADVAKGDTNHDNRILALAVLLSSTLIYNILGTLRDNDLQMLSYVTEVCRQLMTSENAHLKGGFDDEIFCPIFILALRDFSLEMAKDGIPITTDSYLNDFCLKTMQGKSEKERSYNETRQCIEKYFKTRKCFTFDRPGNRTTLQHLETMENSNLSDDFVQDSEKFVGYVHRQSHPKRLDRAHTMTGSSFATLVKTYVEAIRNGRIPNVRNVLSATVEIENRKAVEDCCKIYINEMHICLLPALDEQSFLDHHKKCKKRAIDYFLTKSICDEEKIYYEDANKKIDEEYNRFSLKNDVESEKRCNSTLCELNGEMQKKLNDYVYLRSGGSKEYESDLNALKENYNCRNDLGCKKEETLKKFLERKQSEGEMIKQADQRMTDKESELDAEKETSSLLAKKKSELELQTKKYEEKLQDMSSQLSKTNEKLRKSEENHKIELKNMQEKHTQKLKKDLAKQKRTFDEELRRVTDDLNKQIKIKKEANDLLEEKLKSMKMGSMCCCCCGLNKMN